MGRGQRRSAGPAQQNGSSRPYPGRRPAARPGRPTAASGGRPEYLDGRGGSGSYDPAPQHHDDVPGHTRTFSVGDLPGGEQPPYGPAGQSPYPADGPGDVGDVGNTGNVSTYRAGQPSAPPAGPRLPWQDLLRGLVMHPDRTFWRTRDHQIWGPALIVTFVYGLLVVFGFDGARGDVLSAPFSSAVPWVLTTALTVVICAVILNGVTHALARQFGGDGSWAPTIGLGMLVMTLTDAPRLLFAIFLGGGNGLVQIIGWATWLGCAVLLTRMVRTSHDLPWPKALGAASIQLVALLVLFKLPTL